MKILTIIVASLNFYYLLWTLIYLFTHKYKHWVFIVKSCSFILATSSSQYHTSIHSIFLSLSFFPSKETILNKVEENLPTISFSNSIPGLSEYFYYWLGSRGFVHNQLIVHDYYFPLLLIIGSIVVSSLLPQSEVSGPQMCSSISSSSRFSS